MPAPLHWHGLHELAGKCPRTVIECHSATQECARAVVIFAFGLLLMRFSGRRIFAQWSALDIVVAFTAGSNLSRAITGPVPLFGTMAAMAEPRPIRLLGVISERVTAYLSVSASLSVSSHSARS